MPETARFIPKIVSPTDESAQRRLSEIALPERKVKIRLMAETWTGFARPPRHRQHRGKLEPEKYVLFSPPYRLLAQRSFRQCHGQRLHARNRTSHCQVQE
jgi:hypothetical protein